MASQVNPPRGMRDFLPADKARRERVLGVIRHTFRAHGFDEIETPVVEDSARLHAGLGGDNEKLAFGILKRGLTQEDFARATDALDLADLGLRFDLTVPLARFYASHRAELPPVFRAIQMAPVWRAERPQKGRYRQFVQCDIDIIGEPGQLAEVELIVAAVDTLAALGLEGCTIRVGDRRLLTSMLEAFGFPAAVHAAVLITLDKLDKIEAAGVVAELRSSPFAEEDGVPRAVDALEAFLTRPRTLEFVAYGERAIRRELPAGVDEAAVEHLVSLGDAVEAAGVDRRLLQFDPYLVRGMGYYTGTIFEVAHPDFGYSLAGGGRYDGMIGRFLGTEVPAVGFSLGFERLIDLVALRDGDDEDQIALIYDIDVQPSQLARLKAALVAGGSRVRLEKRTRNQRAQLDQLRAAGFGRFAFVTSATTEASELELRSID
ncbi:histidyl-tRNA synthetase [Galbitalea soli]|nr:histidyl-tRNA synthetase [Galbitalea soli]